MVALTMTPALCVMLLKHEHKQTAKFFCGLTIGSTVTNRYVGTVVFMVRRGFIGLTLMIVISATAKQWQKTCSLVPDEDQGYYMIAVFLPDGSSLERTAEVADKVIAAAKSNQLMKTWWLYRHGLYWRRL